MEKKRYSDNRTEEFSLKNNINLKNIINKQKNICDNYNASPTDMIISSINTVFISFIQEHNIPVPHIPFFTQFDNSLTLKEKILVQSTLHEHSNNLSQHKFPDFLDINLPLIKVCSSCVYLYDKFIIKNITNKRNKILYAFTYMLNRSLTPEEITYIDLLLDEFQVNLELSKILIHIFELKQAKQEYEQLYSNSNKYKEYGKKISDELNQNTSSLDLTDDQIDEKISIYPQIERCFKENTECDLENKSRQLGYNNLFDKLFDCLYNDMLFSYINLLYSDSNENSKTYYKFISQYQENLEIYPDIKKELNNIFCDTIRKHLTRKIFINDDREAFYRKTRGYKNINDRTSIPYCQQYVMQLIFLGTKLQKSDYTEEKYEEKKEEIKTGIPYKDFHQYYQNLKITAKKVLFPHLKEECTDEEFEKFQNGFRYFLQFFHCENKQLKHASLKSKIDDVFFFIENTKKYFTCCNDDKMKWFNFNSIFVSKWNFITNCSSTFFNRIKREASEQKDLSNDDYIYMYIKYCHDISKLSYPHLLKELLEEPAYFHQYLISRNWLDTLIYLLNYLEQITSYVISKINGLSETAFSSTEEDLVFLYDILYYYDYDPSLESSVTPDSLDELSQFMSLYLPKKQ